MPIFSMFRPKKTTPKDVAKMAKNDPSSLGNILLEKDKISEEELSKAVDHQTSQRLLGEILKEVTSGRLTDDDIHDACMEQKIRRNQCSFKEESDYYRRRKKKLTDDINDSFTAIETKLAGG